MTISGRCLVMTAPRLPRSRISPSTDSMTSATRASKNRLGVVGGGSEYPTTFAPSFFSHNHNPAPLKPVCPVTSTTFPDQNPCVIYHTFQGTCPELHIVSRSIRSLSVSIGCQKP